MGRHGLRTLIVVCIVLFCVAEAVYVSLPDYPYDGKACEIMLWGEKTQWWSEITWIILFGVFSTSLIYLMGWNRELQRRTRHPSHQTQVRLILIVGLLMILYCFSISYFQWHGWAGTFVLDRGGYLHGAFYLTTAFLGLLCFEEGLFLGSGLTRVIWRRLDGQRAS